MLRASVRNFGQNTKWDLLPTWEYAGITVLCITALKDTERKCVWHTEGSGNTPPSWHSSEVLLYCYTKLQTTHTKSWKPIRMETDWISTSPHDSGAFHFVLCCVMRTRFLTSLPKPFGNQLGFLCLSLFEALNNVPADLPSDIVKLDLSRNNIRQLRPKQFLLSKDLKLLNLSSNNLYNIDTGNTAAPSSKTLHIHTWDTEICAFVGSGF